MKKIINLYKRVGQTPLQAIDRFRENNPSYKNVKMSYAGRLDPMAEGVLLVLVGEENKKMKQHMRLDKEYRAEILIGIRSDSHDVLGIASFSNDKNDKGKSKELMEKIKGLRGSYEQKIPKYSSYRIKGKPMFYYALKGIAVEEIKKKVIIKSVKINSTYDVNNKRLLKYVLSKIDKVKGDFRQSVIKKRWNELLGDSRDERKFLVIDVTINCSSGTYIRAIADDLNGLLLSLKRTKVGRFDINKSLKLR